MVGSRWAELQSVLAVPFLALGNIELEAVRAGKVPQPGWSPEIALPDRLPKRPGSPVKLRNRGADRVKRGVLRSEGSFLHRSPRYSSPSAKETGPAGKIEQIAVDSEITQRQLKFAALVQSNINSADGGLAVPTKESQKRIKCCSRISIQQRFAQA